MGRLIIASNRLPVKINKENGGFTLETSAGGLATGLKSYHKSNNSIWLGWPGLEVTLPAEQQQIAELLAVEHCAPIYLENELIENYYGGFSNDTIWPLFHYFFTCIYEMGEIVTIDW